MTKTGENSFLVDDTQSRNALCSFVVIGLQSTIQMLISHSLEKKGTPHRPFNERFGQLEVRDD